MVKLLDNTKGEMLRVFPGLDECWDRDGGVTFLEDFFLIYQYKMKLFHQWEEVKFYHQPHPDFLALDIDVLKIRLTPTSFNNRPYFTEEQDDYLDELEEKSLFEPVSLSREQYLQTIEMLMNHTIPDEENSQRMKSWINSTYELKQMGGHHEKRFRTCKRKNSKSRTLNNNHHWWHGIRHICIRQPK